MGAQYARAFLLTNGEGATAMYAESNVEKAAKNHKISFRNVWKLDFPQDFLKLVSADEFEDALAQTAGPRSAPDAPSYPTYAPGRSTAEKLSPGFDMRAQEILSTLVHAT